jgi:NADPH-dependent glutamate synthase beta subunit-like oxidoreductase
MENTSTTTTFKHKEINAKHYVAVIGGSVSGSEAVNLLTEQNFKVVVFDMNKLPYGKLEDGLPNWHHNLRDRQIETINERLNHQNVFFIPNTKIGVDISFDELKNDWGFSSVILANGAWKDRELPVNEINKFLNNGLIYQNSLIYWFNHKHEKNYDGPHYEMKNNTLVVGGGLASLDVMKIIMIELVQKALKEIKNVAVDMLTLEKKGIDLILEQFETTLEELNIIPPTLLYRRNAEDMPLKSPKDDTAENIEKAKAVSQKLLEKYVEKYMFNFIPCSSPSAFIEKNGKFVGMKFQKMINENGKLTKSEETFKLYSELLISSIGSIPEKIESLNYDGDALKLKNNSEYAVYGYENVFAIGNAVTGKGNIQDSKQHGKQMTEKIINEHLNEDALEEWLVAYNQEIREKTALNVSTIINQVDKFTVPSDDTVAALLKRIKARQEAVGYKDYETWISEHLPERVEDMI